VKKRSHISLITNKYFFIGAVILLLTILTVINNYYFYTHITRSLERSDHQLKDILETEVDFCRKNRISDKRYKEKIINILDDFSHYNYYNNTLILKGYKHRSNKIEIIWKKDKKDWDKVSLSNIYITIPKIKSKDSLVFDSTIIFDNTLYLNSIVKSMTFSVFEWVPQLIKGETLHWKTYWYRSRPAVGFLIFTLILLFIVRKREEVMFKLEKEQKDKISKIEKEEEERKREMEEKYKQEMQKKDEEHQKEIRKKEEEAQKNEKMRKIFETIGGEEQNDDIEAYEAIINNDMKQLRNIKSLNPIMNILKFNALIEHTEDEKLEKLQILIDKGIDLKFVDDDGMNTLMFYALGNQNNDENSKIIPLLIKYGLDIDAQNKSGMTALMLCAMKNRLASVKILVINGANINIKQDLTAFDLATNDEIKKILERNINNHPKKLVKLLKNFTLDKPIKYSTHYWDFNLQNEYKDFDGFIQAMQENFNSIKDELQELAPNFYKKIYIFLFESNPSDDYSWCSKTKINMGWSSIDGLKEWCDNGKKPSDFKLKKPILFNKKPIAKSFEDVINLFKQEIEIRSDFKNLSNIFNMQKKNLGSQFVFEPSKSKLDRQFYIDTHNLNEAIHLMFKEFKKREEFNQIELTTKQYEDNSIELRIRQKDSESSQISTEFLTKIESTGGDMGNIKTLLFNLCDWSIEGTFNKENCRINLLYSNNSKNIEKLEKSSGGFIHILRFYK